MAPIVVPHAVSTAAVAAIVGATDGATRGGRAAMDGAVPSAASQPESPPEPGESTRAGAVVQPVRMTAEPTSTGTPSLAEASVLSASVAEAAATSAAAARPGATPLPAAAPEPQTNVAALTSERAPPSAALAPPVASPEPRATAQPQMPATTAPRARVPGEELIADLFESMHELHFLRDALEGGEFCLSLAMEKIPSQAGIVHLYDIDRREFLVTSARGASTLLLRRHPESDALLFPAMKKGRAFVLADASQSDAASLDRYVALGGARSVIIAPVALSGRFLGAIELVNPLDGQPYTTAEGNAVTYIAQQFAEFLDAHGVVTDPQRIRSRAG